MVVSFHFNMQKQKDRENYNFCLYNILDNKWCDSGRIKAIIKHIILQSSFGQCFHTWILRRVDCDGATHYTEVRNTNPIVDEPGAKLLQNMLVKGWTEPISWNVIQL